MRFIYTTVCSLTAGILFGMLATTGAIGATVPTAESFESYTNDHPITLEADWSASGGDDGLVSTNQFAIQALGTYTGGGGTLPLPGASHDKVLAMTDALVNTVGSDTGGVVIAEWLVMPAQRDAAPTASTNYQMAFYVSTNSELVIWHKDPGGGPVNQWLTLSGNPSISTGEWVRVTVLQDYVTDRFQISVDGTAYANALGETRAGANPGSWYHMVQTNGFLSRFRTEGKATAYLDDMVFTNRSVSYDGTIFAEAAANDGSIATTRTMTLVGDTFVNTAYSEGTHFSTSGVPAGLTVTVTYASPTTVSVTLTGNAAAHTSAANTSALEVTLDDDIFTLGSGADVDGASRTDLSVNFDDAPTLAYVPETFTEGVANDGSLGNTVVITLTGDTFFNTTPFVESTHFTTSTVPAGLTVSIVRDSATQLTVSLVGTAIAHGDTADTSMGLTFLDAAFDTVAAADITDSTKALAVDFADAAAMSYATTTYAEQTVNDGSLIGGTISVAAENFTGAIGTNYVLGGEVLVSNLPLGLGVSIQKTAAQQLSVTFTAAATLHADGNDISNLTFAFQDGAFSGGSAAGVIDATRSDLSVDFVDPPVVTYGSTTFTEVAGNNGTITDTLTVTLVGDTFVDDGDFNETDEYTVSAEPGGLSVSIVRNSATQLTVSLTGTAAAHANANDIANLTVALQDEAFTTVAAANISGASRNDLVVDFDDQPVIAYSGTVFTELSLGTIDNTSPIEITISGDAFTGSNGSDFVADGKVTVGNLPVNLTAVLTRDSSTKLLATLTGTATLHANANDVNNLTFTFEDTAYTADGNQATDYNRSNLQIDYDDSVVAVNLVPFSESFEGYADGYGIGNVEGWSPEGDGVVTTKTAIVTALGVGLDYDRFPLITSHTQVLCADGNANLSNEIKSQAGESVYSDVMIYMTARSQVPAGSTDYQFAVYANTNQQLVVWHRDTSGTPTNVWTTLTAGPTVTTSAWHRLTIEQDFANQRFRFRLDGSFYPLTNPTSGDQWFNMVGTANNYLSRMKLLGGTDDVPSYLDDINVTTDRFDYWDRTLFNFR
ncbi:MAG: hypothetical protein ACI856_001878 [Kiritimatiellia bacterium]|jgi:hypothetical protein